MFFLLNGLIIFTLIMSTTSTENNMNHDFCDFLLELADYEKNVNRNIFKSNAYRKAASTLSKLTYRINSGKDAQNVEGIGKSIAKKIDEFFVTGKLKKIDTIREHGAQYAKSISELTRVSGIGPAKAKALFEKGIFTIEELKKNEDLLTHFQIIGLRYLEDFEKRIPRKVIVDFEPKLRTAISNLDSRFELTICGSYRRGLPECGDIDVLLTHPKFVSSQMKEKKSIYLLKQVVEELISRDIISETLALGPVKFMGACFLNNKMRRIDIRLTPYDQYYCAVLYFTGSDVFNQKMRKHAQNMNFILNEYTLRRVGSTGVIGEPVSITSEKDIFDHIDYPFKLPNERNI